MGASYNSPPGAQSVHVLRITGTGADGQSIYRGGVSGREEWVVVDGLYEPNIVLSQ